MSNLWLNPALLRQTRDAASLPINGEPAPDDFAVPGPRQGAGLVGDLPRGGRPSPGAARRRRAPSRRRCLRLAALALLGASAAFSYVAWSEVVRGNGAPMAAEPLGEF